MPDNVSQEEWLETLRNVTRQEWVETINPERDEGTAIYLFCDAEKQYDSVYIPSITAYRARDYAKLFLATRTPPREEESEARGHSREDEGGRRAGTLGLVEWQWVPNSVAGFEDVSLHPCGGDSCVKTADCVQPGCFCIPKPEGKCNKRFRPE